MMPLFGSGTTQSPSFESAIAAHHGETLTVLEANCGEWLLVRKAGGAEGYVPRSAVCSPGRYCHSHEPPSESYGRSLWQLERVSANNRMALGLGEWL
jgi:hypothetical protein